MKTLKLIALMSALVLGASCAHHRGGCGSCCEKMEKAGKECCKEKGGCKDGQCALKKEGQSDTTGTSIEEKKP